MATNFTLSEDKVVIVICPNKTSLDYHDQIHHVMDMLAVVHYFINSIKKHITFFIQGLFENVEPEDIVAVS